MSFTIMFTTSMKIAFSDRTIIRIVFTMHINHSSYLFFQTDYTKGMCCWAVGLGLNLGLWLKVIILPLYHWSFYQNSWKLDNWFMSIKREFVTTKCEQEVIVVYFSSKQLWAVIHTWYIYLIQDRISFFSCLFFCGFYQDNFTFD